MEGKTNLIFALVDSLRWDYAEKCGLFDAMKPANVFKCHVLGETTTISLPQILSGIKKPRNTTKGYTMTRNGQMWLTRLDEKTMFDYFRDAGYYTQYINIHREDPTFTGNNLSFFTNLPFGNSLKVVMEFEPFFAMLHFWDVHYPHPKGYEYYVKDFIRNRLPALLNWKDTIVVLMADHGEMLGENERWGHSPPMTKELQEVPLIIYPAEEHTLHDKVVESIRVLPTILDLFGIEHKLGGSIYEETKRG